MTEIEELLAKLEKLDPETWNCYQHRLAPLRDTPCDMRRGKIITLSILQGVIQDVIAAHSGWSIDFDGPHPWAINLWRCQISFGDFRTAWGGTPAEAILAAYVAALEAEREAMTDG